MESNFDTPVSTLKVDLGCTRDCPTDVKNMLEQLKGVKSISIDPNQGKVTVVGNVNPMMLIKLLQQMGKKAQLWSFDKAPQRKKVGSHPKHKHKQTSHCCCNSDSDDASGTDFHDSHSSCKHKLHSSRHSQRSKKRHGQKYQFGSPDKHAAPATTGYHPPMPGYHQQHAAPTTGYHPPMPGYQSFTGYNFPMQYQPLAYARPVPRYGYYGRIQPMSSSYLHPHYGSRFLQQHSPMIHYTSYADNYYYTM